MALVLKSGKMVQLLQKFYKVPRVTTKDYLDITKSFEQVYTSNTNTKLLFDNSRFFL